MVKKLFLSTLILSLSATMLGMEMAPQASSQLEDKALVNKPAKEPMSMQAQTLLHLMQENTDAFWKLPQGLQQTYFLVLNAQRELARLGSLNESVSFLTYYIDDFLHFAQDSDTEDSGSDSECSCSDSESDTDADSNSDSESDTDEIDAEGLNRQDRKFLKHLVEHLDDIIDTDNPDNFKQGKRQHQIESLATIRHNRLLKTASVCKHLEQVINDTVAMEVLPLLFADSHDQQLIKDFLLYCAFLLKNYDAARFLVSHGSSIEAKLPGLLDYKCFAAWAIDSFIRDEVLEFLLSVGLDPNSDIVEDGFDGFGQPGKYLRKLLYLAVRSNNPKMVKLLLKYGADCKMAIVTNKNVFKKQDNSVIWISPIGLATLVADNQQIDSTRLKILEIILNSTEFDSQERTNLIKFMQDHRAENTQALSVILNYFRNH